MSLEKKSTVNLQTVAERVGLAPCSVSAILNNTPALHVIPQTTKDRVFRAATELNYRPNLWARSLRTKRTRMVAAVASDFGSVAVARVVAGAQRRFIREGICSRWDQRNFPTQTRLHSSSSEASKGSLPLMRACRGNPNCRLLRST